MNESMLSTGIYSIPQAAALLGIHPARLRVWVRGSAGALGRPLIRSELPRVQGRVALSFVNLIEAKFIELFASKGVSVRSMRYMAKEAERFLQHPHPFATDWIFKTDGKKIFVEAAERAGDPCLYDLKGHNFAMHGILAKEFMDDVQFSAAGIADAWFPRIDIAPHVRVSPKVAFGSPALEGSGVPTEALHAALKAEGGDVATVAAWFDVSESDVIEAARFEDALKSVH